VIVAIDEHVPPAMARAFERFAEEKQFNRLMSGIKIELAQNFYPQKDDADYVAKSDAPWIRRFARSGGRFIISGNTAMMSVPHERAALAQEGITVFFFGSQWNEWKFFHKCALLMACWPLIAEEMKRKRKKPRFWRIPSTFAQDAKLHSVPIVDAKALKIAKQKAAQKKIAKDRKTRRAAPAQAVLPFMEKSGVTKKRSRKKP
jgi:hypothetical protein